MAVVLLREAHCHHSHQKSVQLLHTLTWCTQVQRFSIVRCALPFLLGIHPLELFVVLELRIKVDLNIIQHIALHWGILIDCVNINNSKILKSS